MKTVNIKKVKEDLPKKQKVVKQGSVKPERRSVLARLKALFKKEKISYRLIPHAEVYTAPEVAASIHAPGRQVAKVVMVRADGRFAMAVLPSHRQVDLSRFGKMIGASHVALAKEWEIEKLCPDCEAGTMPPFGDLYGLPVYVDKSLVREPEIFFQAGSHHEVIEMHEDDFKRLARPKLGHFLQEQVNVGIG